MTFVFFTVKKWVTLHDDFLAVCYFDQNERLLMNSESANNKCSTILNEEMGKIVNPQGFMLDPTQKYVID